MAGILYGVGVGPGDPELMTLKAVRMIEENEVIAVPGEEAKEAFAYQIALGAVSSLADKTLVPVYMPMIHDKEEMRKKHIEGAKLLESYLMQGKNVVFLTLGDPTIYSTFSYLQEIVKEDGFETALVSGIPSFCAAAARINEPLVLGKEELHILPAYHSGEKLLEPEENYVLMKSGRRMKEVKQLLSRSGREAAMVENCGTKDECVYHGIEEIPDDAGYYSLIIAKKEKDAKESKDD
jgi:precorrin-2/cobalt-factor-2 C20-methyltransferase